MHNQKHILTSTILSESIMFEQMRHERIRMEKRKKKNLHIWNPDFLKGHGEKCNSFSQDDDDES